MSSSSEQNICEYLHDDNFRFKQMKQISERIISMYSYFYQTATEDSTSTKSTQLYTKGIQEKVISYK